MASPSGKLEHTLPHRVALDPQNGLQFNESLPNKKPPPQLGTHRAQSSCITVRDVSERKFSSFRLFGTTIFEEISNDYNVASFSL